MAKKKNSTKKLLIILGALFVLVIGAAAVGAATGAFGGGDRGTPVELAEITLRDITQVVTASGRVQPEVEVNISPDVSGEIIDLRVREGDQVTKGDLLARIKQDDYLAQLEQAEAGVLQAKANEAQRRADMLIAGLERDRQKMLFEANAVSEADYQRSSTQFDVAEAGLEAARYSVRSAEARQRESRELLAKTTIYAPMSGTVSKLDIELGERVVGTSQMQGTEIMRIARLDQMEIEVDVNENDVVNIAIGDTARIEVDAYPERSFRGAVTEIANSARVSGSGTQEQVTNFPVKIRVVDPHNTDSGPDSGLRAGVTSAEVPEPEHVVPTFRPGMSGTVDVFTQTVASVVAVPIQAVTVRDFMQVDPGPDGFGRKSSGSDDTDTDADADSAASGSRPSTKEDLKKVVFVMQDGKARMLEVTTGISDDTHIVVKTGAEEGMQCIIGPYSVVSRTLRPGMTVRERDEGSTGGRS